MKNPQSSHAPARGSDAGSPEPGTSPWSPLRQAVFRAVWIASITSSIGTWMQSVGAAWLMTSLTPSPLLVALMQTAASLPIFLLGLPAGALADVVDRRKLLLVTESWMLLVAPVAAHLIAARAYDRRIPAEPPHGEAQARKSVGPPGIKVSLEANFVPSRLVMVLR